MRYNYKELLLPASELDFYDRLAWNFLSKTSVNFIINLQDSSEIFKIDSFLRLPDLTGVNDVNLIKSFGFLFTLFYGLSINFKLNTLSKPKVMVQNKLNSDKFTVYFYSRLKLNNIFFTQLTFIIYYLLPYLRSKQSDFKILRKSDKLVLSFIDLSHLVTGAGSLSLYYDYFDWENVILVVNLFFNFNQNKNSFDLENTIFIYNSLRLL